MTRSDAVPGWEICPGGDLEHVGNHWHRCPSCGWVGWKQRPSRPPITPIHQRPKP